MNKQSLTLRFNGSVTALSPISFTTPDSKDKLPRLGGKMYLTASSLRSTMRHHAVSFLQSALASTMSLDDYVLNAQGGIKDAKAPAPDKNDAADEAPEQDDAQSEKAKKDKADKQAADDKAQIYRIRLAREKNPILTTFGSMEVGIPGALYCGHAVADVFADPEKISFTRANDFARDPRVFDTLNDSALDELVVRMDAARQRSQMETRIKAVNAEAVKAKKSGDRDEESRLKDVAAALKKEKESLTAVQLLMPLAYEAIPADTQFSHAMTLFDATPMDLTVLLLGLRGLASEPFIGGKRFHGLGHISARWDVTGRRGLYGPLLPMGSVSFSGDFGDLSVEGEIADLFDEKGLLDALRGGSVDLSASIFKGIA